MLAAGTAGAVFRLTLNLDSSAKRDPIFLRLFSLLVQQLSSLSIGILQENSCQRHVPTDNMHLAKLQKY